MKGVFFSHDLPGLCEIRDFEIWKPAPDEILIKNVAVASNPKDWKVPLTIKERSAIEGNDIAGYVEEVGSGVSGFEKGDKVAAFTKMRSESKYGAYAEYSVSPANTVWHVAESTSFEDVVTLPLAVMTACMSLYKVLKLELPPSSGEQGSASGVLLINGASTTIGIYGVQLAKRSGYKVIGIAGASSDLAMSYGFDAVIDYRDKSASEIAKAVKTAIEQFGSLVGVFDAVSEKSTIEMIAYEILQPEGGNIVTVLPPYEDGGLKVDNVSLVRNQVGWSHGQYADFASEWFKNIGRWLDDGSFKPMAKKIMPNGLDSVQEGMRLLKENKVSGQKLVYRIADSQCIPSQP